MGRPKKKIKAGPKEGRPSNHEIEYVRRNFRLKSIEEVARDLNRSEKVIATLFRKVADEEGDLDNDRTRFQLKRRSFYRQLQKQMSDEELEKFEEEWNLILKQFKFDILPTEEYQLISSITCTIMIDRSLAERKRWMDDLANIEAELKRLYEVELALLAPEETQRIITLEQDRTNIRASFQYNTKERLDIEKQREAYMKSLKGTRDQRIDRSTDVTTTWPDLVRATQDKKKQMQMTRDAALLHMAGQIDYKRLGQYHTFQDGMVDQPILNSETFLGAQNEENNQGRTGNGNILSGDGQNSGNSVDAP
jgi:hypothetical protein